MGSCCEDNCALEFLQQRQRGTLIKVLWINAMMFIVIVIAAYIAESSALFSDSLDNLGDALTYGLSLYAVSKGVSTKARVALFKGSLIFLAASLVIAQVVHRIIYPVIPSYELMGLFSLLSLIGNASCLYLLWQHRREDINMSSVFECSRNDIASNLSVILAAVGVWLFDSGLPDIILATLLAGMLLRSSFRVVSGAMVELAKNRKQPD
ncbi:MAG: Co/Zn/Cd efflux system component [Cycloclasticus sp.]